MKYGINNENIDLGSDGYSNFATPPIYYVKSTKGLILSNPKQSMKIVAGQTGTFQQHTGVVYEGSMGGQAIATFGNNKISVPYGYLPSNPNGLRTWLQKMGFIILSVSSDSKKGKTNYSNIDNENNIDVINENLLDDNFSNATGCGVKPVCVEKKLQKGTIRSCKTIFGKQVCINKPTLKTVVNQACVNNKARYNACMKDPNRKKLSDKVKDIVKKTEKDIKKGVTKYKANVKKKITKLKDKVGALGKNFRNKFRGVMRRGILFNIKNNIHGTASRLFPAVASDSEVAGKKYKKSFVSKSRGMYSQVLAKWKSLGGNENDLKNAIRQGSSKRFLKAPYKSFNGDDSMALYLHYTPSNRVYMENPNTTFYYNVEGDDEEVVVDESAEMTEEVPSQEEEVKGIRAFFAWLASIFNKNKADENPYAEDTSEYDQYSNDASADAGNQPDSSEANDPDINDIYSRGNEDGAGTEDDEFAGDDETEGSDTIMGINKTAFWIGVGVIALIGGFVTYKLVTKKGK